MPGGGASGNGSLKRQGQAIQALLVPKFISSPDHYIQIHQRGEFPGSSVV